MARYAVAGVSGNTGGATARALLARGAPVRVVVRDPVKGEPWEAAGAEVAVADLGDPAALAAALRGVTAAYVLNPPAYALPDLFARAEQLAESILQAARAAGRPRLVVLSSIGAHLPAGTGNILTNRAFERVLGPPERASTFLRPAYFMENWAWVAPVAAEQGVLPSFLAPLDRAIPMVSVADVGEAAAQALLDEDGAGTVIELAGPRSYSPAAAAAAFAAALGRPVTAVAVPEEGWPAALASSGFSARTIASWQELFRAFNTGAIDFERRGGEPARGGTPLEDAIAAVVRGR
ncbi:MAG TPA: NAD(P)H-binding protein [Vicinamibacteria bacterium]